MRAFLLALLIVAWQALGETIPLSFCEQTYPSARYTAGGTGDNEVTNLLLDNSIGFGSAIVPLGDLNGDSVMDIAVGAPFHEGGSQYSEGKVYILLMNSDYGVISDTIIPSLETTLPANDNNGRYFGMSLAHMGDFANDGRITLAVGAPYDDSAISSPSFGAVYLTYLDQPNGDFTDWDKISYYEGGGETWLTRVHSRAELGYGIANIGDLDGDNVEDIFVTMPFFSDLKNNIGAAYVMFLQTNSQFHSDNNSVITLKNAQMIVFDDGVDASVDPIVKDYILYRDEAHFRKKIIGKDTRKISIKSSLTATQRSTRAVVYRK